MEYEMFALYLLIVYLSVGLQLSYARRYCWINNGGCEQICTESSNCAKCRCYDGYFLDSDHRACIDVDECGTPSFSGCADSETCQNTPGSYLCVAKMGFVKSTSVVTMFTIPAVLGLLMGLSALSLLVIGMMIFIWYDNRNLRKQTKHMKIKWPKKQPLKRVYSIVSDIFPEFPITCKSNVAYQFQSELCSPLPKSSSLMRLFGHPVEDTIPLVADVHTDNKSDGNDGTKKTDPGLRHASDGYEVLEAFSEIVSGLQSNNGDASQNSTAPLMWPEGEFSEIVSAENSMTHL